MWSDGGITHTQTISDSLSGSLAVFVTDIGELYADNGDNSRVDRWTINANKSEPAMYVNGRCTGLFIDTNDTLYCSIWNMHQVRKRSLSKNINTTIIAVGTGTAGSTSDSLCEPHRIFVDINLKLYLADCGNNRIQRFEWEQQNGTTVAGGNGQIGNITLNCPTDVVLDTDSYLFIVDRGSGRIYRSDTNGFRCLVGCFGFGSNTDQLNNPQTLSFDVYGNIFVTDRLNNRIQKFLLAKNACGTY